MHATCPNNPEHKRFLTVAHVSEEWLVNENGDFIEKKQVLETVQEPSPDNSWYCYDCPVGPDGYVEVEVQR